MYIMYKMYKKFVFPFGSFLDGFNFCVLIYNDKYITYNNRECFLMYFLFVNWTNKKTKNRLRRGSNADALLG